MFSRHFHYFFLTPIFKLWSWYVLFIEYIASFIFICVDTLTMEVRKLGDVLGSQVGKIIDFIIRGFLLMLRLRNNGMANKQLYGLYI